MGEQLKRTPLYEKHKENGGRIIDFGGWELPVQYESGILKEHEMVRTRAGLFDVSHMGEITVEGKDAFSFIQSVITNDLTKVEDGQVQYSPLCYENGGCVDDLIVYRFSEDRFLLVVNASNTDKDYEWLQQHTNSFGNLRLENVSQRYTQLSLQGPKAQEILQNLTDMDLSSIRFFRFMPEIAIAKKNCLVSRTGYTGEDGFEIYTANENANSLWEAILKTGKEEVTPIGLGARDTLRFEAKLPLYGQEISADISPIEAGLGFFVRVEKEVEFLGKAVLKKQKEEGVSRKLCEFVMKDRGVPRAHYEVEVNGEQVGFVTTGMYAPTLKLNMGLALIPTEFSDPGTMIEIMIRNRPIGAEVRQGVFYSKRTKK